ncbi:MAG: SIR2 family NAD-dependent protein deacylase [Nannocystaceae bacterium]|nr:SIR2 family protein [bacterium]
MTERDERFEDWFDGEASPDVRRALLELVGRPVSPSRALFDLDLDAYRQRKADWIDARLEASLTDGLPNNVGKRNTARFTDLLDRVGRGCVVPFVGAGMSVPSGMPGWSDFLALLASESGCKRVVTSEMRKGRFEDAATVVVERLGVNAFRERYRSSFQLRGLPQGAVRTLPKIASGAVVTTNFDPVLEHTFGPSLRPVLLGHQSSDFCRCVASGQTALLKLHGDIDNAESRVLTKSEYDGAYGGDGRFDFALPIPRGLRVLFSTVTMLFVGCSLGADRTLGLFRHLVDREDARYLPQHYAILPYRTGAVGERFLEERHIFPIWYPNGRHEVLDALLEHLAGEAGK